jgi:hypothetical protein
VPHLPSEKVEAASSRFFRCGSIGISIVVGSVSSVSSNAAGGLNLRVSCLWRRASDRFFLTTRALPPSLYKLRRTGRSLESTKDTEGL